MVVNTPNKEVNGVDCACSPIRWSNPPQIFVVAWNGPKQQNKPISYSTTRKLFLQSLENIRLPSKEFGLHSLRSGGATATANAGITERLFKQHGRWKSESAKDGYVKDNLAALLTVTKWIPIRSHATCSFFVFVCVYFR